MNKWLKRILIVAGIGIIFLAGHFFPIIMLLISTMSAKIEVYDDVSRYEEYLRGGGSKWNKWDMDESIWPRTITPSMTVKDYRMVYYNPWDAQYLGYLAAEYSPEEYAEEAARLKSLPSDDYIGIYDVTEEKTHELLAIHAHPYHGFVYALSVGENEIVYAEQIFCNYFMDLDYSKYIPEDYLLDGFNAVQGNPYRQRMMKERN